MVRYSLDEVSLMARRSPRSSSCAIKTFVILRHDAFLEFGRCFYLRSEGLVEVFESREDGGSQADRFRDVLHLVLQDADAVIDDKFSFVQRFLLGCGVFWERGFGACRDEGLAVDGSESDVSDSSREVLYRGVGVEFNLCHWCNDFLPCCLGGL